MGESSAEQLYRRTLRRILGGLVVSWAVVLPAQAAEPHPACAEAVTRDGVSWAEARLDQAQIALDDGDLDAADTALYEASSLFPRTADVSISARCLGGDTYRRIFELNRRLAEAKADEALATGNRFDGFKSAVVWLVRARAADRVRDLLGELPDDARTVNFVYNLLDSQIQQAQSTTAGVGGDLPPYDFERSESWIDSARSLRDGLMSLAGDRAAEILAAEARHWDGPLTDLERQGMANMDQGNAMLTAVAGEERARELLPQGERPREFYRASRSLQMIGQAMAYAEGGDEGAARQRARTRAERLYELARDEAVALDTRDGLFQYAASFYDLAGDGPRRAEVLVAKARLQPELEAAREERRQAMLAFSREMREKLPSEEEIRQSVERMRKSEAEQQSFKEEADAMEAELGF